MWYSMIHENKNCIHIAYMHMRLLCMWLCRICCQIIFKFFINKFEKNLFFHQIASVIFSMYDMGWYKINTVYHGTHTSHSKYCPMMAMLTLTFVSWLDQMFFFSFWDAFLLFPSTSDPRRGSKGGHRGHRTPPWQIFRGHKPFVTPPPPPYCIWGNYAGWLSYQM